MYRLMRAASVALGLALFVDSLAAQGPTACTDTARTLEQRLDACRAAVKRQDKDPTLRRDLADVLYRLDRYDESLRELDRAVTLRADYGLAHVDRAYALYALDREAEADSALALAARVSPSDAEVQGAVGRAYRQLHRYDEALARYQEAARLEPRKAEWRRQVGEQLFFLDRDEEALVAYREALAIDSTYAPAHADLGYALAYLERNDEAMRSYDAAIRADSTYAPAYHYKARLLMSQQRGDEAIATLRALVAANPKSVDARTGLAEAFLAANRPAEALTELTAAKQLAPNDAGIRNDIGVAHQRLGARDEALAAYREAIALDSTMLLYHTNLVAMLAEMERGDEALAAAERAAKAIPGAESSLQLAGVQQMTGKLQAAEATYRGVIAVDSTNLAARFGLALLLLQLERADEAQATADEAVRLAPDDARSWGMAGLVSYAREKFDDAVAQWSKARSLDESLFADESLNALWEDALQKVALGK